MSKSESSKTASEDESILELLGEFIKSQSGVSGGKPFTVKALFNSGLVGIWKHRRDIGDSADFTRKLREQAGKRHWD